MGLFSKFNDSLSKTKKGFVEKLFDTFTGKEIEKVGCSWGNGYLCDAILF